MSEVNETNTEAQQPSAEVENAQEPSLDSLLSEYDETPKEEQKQEASQPTAPTVTADVQEFMARQIKKEQTEAIQESAKTLREAAGQTHLSEKWFEGQLHVAANQDPRIYAAFENRANNPGAWNAILKTLGKDIAKELTQPQTDEASTESWNAVEASVHSASTSNQAEKQLNWAGMTDSEFMAAKSKLR